MEPLILDLDGAAERFPGAVLAIGTFDGVHLAHRALVREARGVAEELGAPTLALTFEPHPKDVLLPRPPPRLTGARLKAARLVEAGVDAVCVLDFDDRMRTTPGAEFVGGILAGRLRAAAAWVGFNFSFGRGGRGRPEDLVELAAAHGIRAEVLEALDVEGVPVSSTGIRDLLRSGDVAAAAARLGAPHVLTGTVVEGAGRGRGLGFPTANLAVDPPHLLVPRRGVYAGRAEVAGRGYPTLVNIGVNPTFRGDDPGAADPPPPEATKVEAYLVGFEGSLYGEELSVGLERRLRDERRFPDADALVAQIRADLASFTGGEGA